MMSRRRFVLGSAVAALGLPLLDACSLESDDSRYNELVRETWDMHDASDHSPSHTSSALGLHRELVRYATLAPSSHNTQCWKFHLADNAIKVLPDFSRQCPAVDPDHHHLFVSLGCATENLAHAALANGFQAEDEFDLANGGAINLALIPTHAVTSDLFHAISERQSTRNIYDGQAISSSALGLLKKAGTGNGVRVLLFTEKAALENILQYIVQANTAQMQDAAFIQELKSWIRFNPGEAVERRDGLFTEASGNASLPSWLARLLFESFFSAKSENEKYSKHVRSSAGIAVFFSEANEPAQWVEVGRCYERFALQATALGIRNAFLNQPVEVSALRSQFANYLNIGERRPDLVVRFGRGSKMPQSLRRTVQSVLV